MKKIIEKRIKELIKIRDNSLGNGTKTKYNFVIGELQNILLDYENGRN